MADQASGLSFEGHQQRHGAGHWIHSHVVDARTTIARNFLYGDRDATVEQLHVFAEEVIPGVESNVVAARAGAVVARTA
jgi:hypothetical protein